MILTIAFCLIASGQCESRRVPDVIYPTIESCQAAGQKLASGISDYLTEHQLRVAAITCAAGPQEPAG